MNTSTQELGAEIADNWLRDSEEEAAFRKQATLIAQQYKHIDYDLPQYCFFEPLPSVIPSKISMQCYLPADCGKKTVECKPDATVKEVLDLLFSKYALVDNKIKQTKTADDFVLKVTGFHEFFRQRNQKLIDFDYIRKCISKKQIPELSLVERSQLVAQMTSESGNTSPAPSLPSPTPSLNSSSSFTPIGAKSKEGFSSTDMPEESLKLRDIHRPLRVRIVGAENIPPPSLPASSAALSAEDWRVYVVGELYHGVQPLHSSPQTTPLVTFTTDPVFGHWLRFESISIKALPAGARLCFTLYLRPTYAKGEVGTATSATASVSEGDIPMGWTICQLRDFRGYLRSGLNIFKLFQDGKRANPIADSTALTAGGKDAASLFIEFERFAQPIAFPAQSEDIAVAMSSPPSRVQIDTLTEDELERVNRVVEQDALYDQTAEERALLWRYRHCCMSKPAALPKVILAALWSEPSHVHEVHRILLEWQRPPPLMALELLDGKFADGLVREVAARHCVEPLSDAELCEILLQLTQVLKFEPYLASPLAVMLLERALACRQLLGQALFWHLKAEAATSKRYSLLLEGYLRGCGYHRREVSKQAEVVRNLAYVAKLIKGIPNTDERLTRLREELGKIRLPPQFFLPLDPRLQVKGLKVEKCKYMDSKKLPLWLVFENADPMGKDIAVIFKHGDDLRQDVLTLQMIRHMDKLWKDHGLDLRMQPYRVVATGDREGMIEVVKDAETTANINATTTAVFRPDPLTNWLRAHNPSEAQFEKAQETFILSCAGYCVATYVLGIGDRHSDNIMMTKHGHLFHIDFGHFLGNFKKKFGIDRERSPFVFTPQFAHIMGGESAPQYNRFVETCCRAYNIVRKHKRDFVTLFSLMVSTGIPELTCTDDIKYLDKTFRSDLSDEAAAEEFKRLIQKSLYTKTQQMMDAFHFFVHRKSKKKSSGSAKK